MQKKQKIVHFLILLIVAICIQHSSFGDENEAFDVKTVTIVNQTPYNLFIDLQINDSDRTGALPNSKIKPLFNLEDYNVKYDIGFAGQPLPSNDPNYHRQARVETNSFWSDLKDTPADPIENTGPENAISNKDLGDSVFMPSVTFKYDGIKTLTITITGDTY